MDSIETELYKEFGSILITAHMQIYTGDFEGADETMLTLYDKIANYYDIECLNCSIPDSALDAIANNPVAPDQEQVVQIDEALEESNQSQSESSPRLQESRGGERSQQLEE